jgi:hypothetical protein
MTGVTYTHRNGETEPPTIEGMYWFRGKGRSEFGYGPTTIECEGRTWVRFSELDGAIYGPFVSIEGNELLQIGLEVEGQWYGPIVPPWEDEGHKLDLSNLVFDKPKPFKGVAFIYDENKGGIAEVDFGEGEIDDEDDSE